MVGKQPHPRIVGRTLIDDHEAKSAPRHPEASVRIYSHLASRVSTKAEFERWQVREELLAKSVIHDITAIQSWLALEKPRLDFLTVDLSMSC